MLVMCALLFTKLMYSMRGNVFVYVVMCGLSVSDVCFTIHNVNVENGCRALLQKYRALLPRCRPLLRRYRARLQRSRSLLQSYKALL